jgi:hypothetical protein
MNNKELAERIVEAVNETDNNYDAVDIVEEILEAKEKSDRTNRVIKKWNDLGFLDGIDKPIKENIAQLYECQARQMLNEDVENGKYYSGDTIPLPLMKTSIKGKKNEG